MGNNTTEDYISPDWDKKSVCNCWRNHVPDWLKTQWHLFDDPTKWVMAEWAKEMADAEGWD